MYNIITGYHQLPIVTVCYIGTTTKPNQLHLLLIHISIQHYLGIF